MTSEMVKGFRDYTEEEAEKRAEIKKIIVGAFEKYGFEPAETPIIEYEEFVKGSPEQAQDEAVSDIFRLKDRGKRALALRYEFTFQLKRLAKNKKLPYKRYQIGEVFRDEPFSGAKARLRQFTQCDVDVIGSTIKDEAEILALTKEVLNNLGMKPVILINSRKLLEEIFDPRVKVLIGVGDRGIKENIFREIDKLDKLDEKEVRKNLKKLKSEKLLDIFKKPESFFRKYKAYKEIEELKKYCKYYNIKVKFQPNLVRGLSYYKGNVFEVKVKGVKESIVAGGSYIFNGVRCTGISFGLDRISSLAKIDIKKEKYLIVSLNQDKEAISLAGKLRKKEKNVTMFYGKPTKALEFANSYGYENVIFVGKEEVKKGKYKVKDMKSGKEVWKKI